jgi:hypothetical protein
MATTTTIPIQNEQELQTPRTGSIQKAPGSTWVHSGIAGQETTSFTAHGGANLTYSTHTTSEFNPNNRQSHTQGKYIASSKDDFHNLSQGLMEHRAYGDLNLISGSPNFFTTAAADKITAIRGDIAAKMAAPEIAVGGKLNNSGTEFKRSGSVDPKSKSTQNQSFPPAPERQDLPAYLEAKQKELTPLEQQLGSGGNINILSCKHLTLAAGTAPTTFDSAFINPVGRAVAKETVFKQEGDKPYKGKYETVQTAVPQVEEKATATNMPFGNIQFKGGNHINLEAGSGGMNMKSMGSMKVYGTGVTMIHGAQTTVTGSAGVAIKSPFVEVGGSDCAQINAEAPNTHVKGKVTIVGDVVIQGNLFVEKNLTVSGSIFCNQRIQASGNITSDQGNIKAEALDVIAQNIRLKKHKHPDGSGPRTAPPIP